MSLDSTAEELGIELVPNLRLRNATDGIFPLAAGYRCASVASCNQWKNPSNYHWPTDTPENIHYDTLADAIRLSEAVIRKLTPTGSETCLVTPRSALVLRPPLRRLFLAVLRRCVSSRASRGARVDVGDLIDGR